MPAASVSIESESAVYLDRCPDESNAPQGVCILTSIAPYAEPGYYTIKQVVGLAEAPIADGYGNSTRLLDPGDYVLYSYGLEHAQAGLPFSVELGRVTRVKTGTLMVAAPRNLWLDIQSGPDLWIAIPSGSQCTEPLYWDSLQGSTAYAVAPGTYTIDGGGELALNGETGCQAWEFEVQLEEGMLSVAKRAQ